MKQEATSIWQAWPILSDLGTHCLQVSVQSTIIEGLQFDSHAICSPMDTSRQLKEDLESVPTSMSVLCWKIVIPHPYAQIRQGHFTDCHNLILAVVQLVHLSLMLCQVLDSSQQFTLFLTVLLTLGKLFVAGMVGFPLSLLVLLNLGICRRLFFLDRLTHLPMIHTLPFQLHLVGVEDAIEGICAFFGQLTSFSVQRTCVAHTLACSLGPTLDVVESPLEGFPLFGNLRIDDRRLSVAMIDINGLITNDKFCLSRTAHLHLGY